MKTSSLLLSFAGLLTVAVAHGHENTVSTFASTVHERFLPANGIRPVSGYYYDAAVIGEESRKVVNPHRLAETFWAKRLLYKSKIAAQRADYLERDRNASHSR